MIKVLGADDFEKLGWCLLPSVLTPEKIVLWRRMLPDNSPGVRIAPKDITLPILLTERLKALGVIPKPLRVTGFNKSDKNNWSLPWHQDRAIGNNRQEPTIEELARRVFLHIALDDSRPGYGCLEIAEGSHQHGGISADRISEIVSLSEIRKPTVYAGDALMLRALSLHRSGIIREGFNRRAIRIDLMDV